MASQNPIFARGLRSGRGGTDCADGIQLKTTASSCGRAASEHESVARGPQLEAISYNPRMHNAGRQKSLRAPKLAPRFAAVCAFALLCCLGAIAAKEFVMPAARPARTYPAHDDHPMEKVVVAVDPYDLEDKASIFTVNYRNYGYMPVFFVITNDGDQPVSLVGMKAQLNTKDRSKLFPATMDDLLRRLSHPSRNDGANRLPIPVPLPKKEVKGGVGRKTWDEIEQAQFGAKAVEPHSSARGFLFFDIADISNPLAGANFYLTGVQDAKGTELMYFEIPMEKYLSAPEVKRP